MADTINYEPKAYASALILALQKLNMDKVNSLAQVIYKTYKKGNTVFLAGNGGSAATASHLACDLQKTTLDKNYNNNVRVKAICLNDNIPLITAWANDYGYEHIFSQQLNALAKKDDILIVISASGNSPNVVNALKQVKKLKIKSFALLGFSGGKAKSLSSDSIVISSFHYGVVEDMHVIVAHMITDLLKTKI